MNNDIAAREAVEKADEELKIAQAKLDETDRSFASIAEKVEDLDTALQRAVKRDPSSKFDSGEGS